MLRANFQNKKVKKKLKYYLMVLIILWGGTMFQTFAQSSFNDIKSVDALDRADTTILIEDSQKGNLSLPEKEKKAKSLLYRFDATIKESIKTEELFTIYAYSPMLDDYNIVVDNKKINLNLVYYYNEGKDETVLILATPIYNEDY